jgi:choline-sulfatase
MLRGPRYKYIHYAVYPPQLYDLEEDSEETRDLAGDPHWADVLETCRRELWTIADPDEIDRLARTHRGGGSIKPAASRR